MKKTIKKFISTVLMMTMFATLFTFAYADENDSSVNPIINDYITALNEKDWSKITEISPNDEYQENVLGLILG